MRTYLLFIYLCVSILTSCVEKTPKIPLTSLGRVTPKSAQVSNVQIKNDQLFISGKNLKDIQQVTIKNNANTYNFEIVSASENQIIANSFSAINFVANTFFDLILSNASGASTFPITFTMANNSITASMLTSMGATKGQVMKFNGSSWVPSSITNAQTYLGTWDATANSPDLTSPSSNPGDYYIVSVGGTFNLVSYAVGDWIISDGYNWQKVANSAVVVSTFNGRRGIVTLQSSDYVSLKDSVTHKITGSSLNDLADLDLTTIPPTNGSVLKFNGGSGKWEPGTPSVGTVTSVSGTLPISVASGSSAPVVSISLANTATDGYLSSADWNTFNNKQGSISAGTTAQYYRGDKSWQTLDTNAVSENVANLYFTNARALGVPLTGFASAAGSIVATDTILQAFGKAQGQINAINTASANYLIKNGTDSITGVVNVGTIGALNLTYTPFNLTDATNKSYVDTGDTGLQNQINAQQSQITKITSIFDNGTSLNFDLNNGVTQFTAASCGAATLTNMANGGTYTIIIKGTTSATCTFTQTGLTFRYVPGNTATVSNSMTVYSFLRAGNDVFVNWVTGYVP
ncbi:MAG: hypothetical protein ACXVLQ_15710 [Bacteriovorax sp.]